MKTEPKLRKAYKAAIPITPETADKLWLLSRAMVHLWNVAIVEATKWLNDKTNKITAYSFNYWLTEAREKEVTLANGSKIPLGKISVDVEREILRKLAGSYQSYFNLKKNKDTRARLPKERTEDWFQTISWSSFSIRDNQLFVPGYNREQIALPLTPYLLERTEGKGVVHVTLAFRSGQFELSLVTAEPLPAVYDKPSFFRAVDLGAGDIAVTDSDGSEFLIASRRPDKYWRAHVKVIQARVEHRKKNSRGWKRLMNARRHIWNKSFEQHASHQRKLAHALVEEKVQCIIIGKAITRLGLSQSKSGTRDEHWGSQNTGYMFRLLRFIKEKAEERGVRLIEVADPVRSGNNADPETKFFASRSMLKTALKKHDIEVPYIFTRKNFSFKQ